MAYQRGSLKKVQRKEGLTWVLRHRIKKDGRWTEATPLVVGLFADLPDEVAANKRVDELGLRVLINCENHTGQIKFNALAEYYLRVEVDPEVTANPMSENTMPILEHYVRDLLIARWGDQIAEDIQPLEIDRKSV